MSRGKKLEAAEIEAAIVACSGILSDAARRLGVSRECVSRRVAKSERLQAAQAQAREDLKDLAEGKLLEKIKSGDTVCLIFFLKTQAKDRGYIERQEIETDPGERVSGAILEIASSIRQRIVSEPGTEGA
jgi:hypothetical protein